MYRNRVKPYVPFHCKLVEPSETRIPGITDNRSACNLWRLIGPESRVCETRRVPDTSKQHAAHCVSARHVLQGATK